jgi:hypothetical protein
MRTDFLSLDLLAQDTFLPALKQHYLFKAAQGIFHAPGRPVLCSPPTSVTQIPERIRDGMWWKKSIFTNAQAFPKTKSERRKRK